MRYGYCRVSSRGQLDGHGLGIQREQVTEAGAQLVFEDVFTGTSMERPEWDRLLSVLEPGDEVVVTRLDRIARTAIGGCEAVRDLLAAGVRVTVLNMGTIDDTPMGRMLVTVMFAMAEFDRDCIVQRLADGRRAAKASDPSYREGRKPIQLDTDKVSELAAREAAGELTVRECAEMLGVSQRTYRRRRDALAA